MKFLNNKSIADHDDRNIYSSSLSKIKEPNILIQTLILIICAFSTLMAALYTKKYIFGIYTRDKFNFIDFRGTTGKGIIIIISLLIIRPIIKAIFFPNGGAIGKSTYYGYHLKSLSIFAVYDGFVTKLRKCITLLAPYVIVTVVSLTMLKLKTINNWSLSYNTLVYFLYINALFSFYDIYNFLFVLFSPKGTVFYDDGKNIYIKDKE